MRQLDILSNDQRVGVLSERDDLWRFGYDERWLSDPAAFDLSPALPRARREHVDGASNRPVQWFFDNLLPEEQLREAVIREAGLHGDDAFALLEYLGAESTGALILRPPGAPPVPQGEPRALSDESLCNRIRNLPTATLAAGAPRRMSIAGAQHKLLVNLVEGRLFEPWGAEPSTHILKPNHPTDDYPASVINEYVIMRLAARLGLEVPKVIRRYTPEPVYIVERFDRSRSAEGLITRLHIIDACQVLNQARNFKYASAHLDTLQRLVQACRNKAAARQRLFRWLVFNLLTGNNDNHLKNLSFFVSQEGVDLAPHYDMLCTAAYTTRALANERATWDEVELAMKLPGIARFSEVTREGLIQTGIALKLGRTAAAREIDRQTSRMLRELDRLVTEIEHEDEHLPPQAQPFLTLEARVLRVIRHGIVKDMLDRLNR